jgi:Tfp pilus assembly protein PilV
MSIAPKRQNKRMDSQPQRGAVLVAALVCLLVVTTLLSTMLQTALRSRRQLHRERDLRQTELLLQAGMARAAFQLANQPEYRGEMWNLPAVAIVGSGGGQVTIDVSIKSDAQAWHVEVMAEYPAGGEKSIRRSHAYSYQAQPGPNQE